ncbi:MAG: HEPN domain-containing protein [Humidesulfovibrio sp.]|nr:HEPN domain-containing protein [Humidesulfovibrio sp.]
MLLTAATFEGFVREMAREYARAKIARVGSFDKLPNKIGPTLWRRTLTGLSSMKFDGTRPGTWMPEAKRRFGAAVEFCQGDISQDIYLDLVGNENNLRSDELNGLFNVCGLNNVCKLASDKKPLLDALGETDPNQADELFKQELGKFIARRNEIAHALKSDCSSSPDEIGTTINLLMGFGAALCETLINAASPPPAS